MYSKSVLQKLTLSHPIHIGTGIMWTINQTQLYATFFLVFSVCVKLWLVAWVYEWAKTKQYLAPAPVSSHRGPLSGHTRRIARFLQTSRYLVWYHQYNDAALASWRLKSPATRLFFLTISSVQHQTKHYGYVLVVLCERNPSVSVGFLGNGQ